MVSLYRKKEDRPDFEQEKEKSQEQEVNSADFSGDELDDGASGDSGDFSGDELDDGVPQQEQEPPADFSGDESGQLQKKETGVSPKGTEGEVIKTGHRGKGLQYAISAVMVLLVLVGAAIYLEKRKSGIGDSEKGSVHQGDRVSIPIPRIRSLIFPFFVIPFEKNKRFTYMSLSISFRLPNEKLRQEMENKRKLLRAIIYDILVKEANNTEGLPSIESLKNSVYENINSALAGGKVKRVFITQFLAV